MIDCCDISVSGLHYALVVFLENVCVLCLPFICWTNITICLNSWALMVDTSELRFDDICALFTMFYSEWRWLFQMWIWMWFWNFDVDKKAYQYYLHDFFRPVHQLLESLVETDCREKANGSMLEKNHNQKSFWVWTMAEQQIHAVIVGECENCIFCFQRWFAMMIHT